ncbi:HAD family hydrolase [Pedobacter deserti]|uniref:HAD family hydrolase n=1 Tax=Pedobacter deserti TaxID=2817382 RepID=UPI00210F1686|nr:HAD hydrolase-like protein [Pedobacter sp. SYSU D00382]
MSTWSDYLNSKSAFVFELDDVLYPEKDYLLQVYYLFAQFMEYGEQVSASEMVPFMQQVYQTEGADEVFGKTAARFGLPEKYRLNFELLMHSAKLPLKLLLFQEILQFLQTVVVERKHIFLFTNGDASTQLNKIRQVEWHGLEQYLKVYFAAESELKPSPAGLLQILDEHQLDRADVLLVGRNEADRICAEQAGVDFLNVEKLLLT